MVRPVRSVQAPDLTEVSRLAAVLQLEKLPGLVESQTLACGLVPHLSCRLVVTPGLVPPPPVALDDLHLGAETSSIQAVVVPEHLRKGISSIMPKAKV